MKVRSRKKLEMIGITLLLLLVAYVTIQYLLPLVWPFIVAYGIACLIYPVARFLHKKLHFHRIAAAAMTLIASLIVIVVGLYFVAETILVQVMALVKNWPVYQEQILAYLERACGILESAFRVEDGALYHVVYDGVGNILGYWQDELVPMVMTNSINTFMILMDGLIIIVLVVMAIFYMLKDMDSIRTVDKSNMFYDEIVYLKGLVSKILRAYVRSQAIIMAAVAAVCAVGLGIIGNDYNILIGIVIGLSDALPLIGVGTILVPWSLVCIFTGNYLHGAVLFVVFIVCYFIREFLEPRLMGQEIGLSPISTLVSIFVGYRLFGFLGMIVGPFVAVMLREILAVVKSRGR